MLGGPLFLACKECFRMRIFNNPAKAAFQIFGMGALLLYGAVTHADSAQELRERQRVYQQDRQRCLSGQSGQEQASCLQEAGAVLQLAPGALAHVGAAELSDNALQRCDGLPDGERQSCVARMHGQGRVEGSTASGGILRELTEPAQ
jgi:hypothetical protein